MSPAPGTRPRSLPAWRRAAHLFAFSVLAVAAPLLDLLAHEPTFLLAHRAGAADVWLLALGLCLGLPLALLAIEATAAAISVRLATAWHLATVAVLAAVAATQALARLPQLPAAATMALAALAGLAVAAATATVAPWRAFLAVLAPLLLIVPVRFLAAEGIAGLRRDVPGAAYAAAAANRIARPAPVIVLVFDELPLFSLMDAGGGIDAARFPAFAALARQATWYRGAVTVAQNTNYAVPAILTGRRPTVRATPDAQSYPENLFTLLAGGYRMRVVEPFTALCPPLLCPPVGRQPLERRLRAIGADLAVVFAHLTLPDVLRRRHLPPIDNAWTGFARDFASATGPPDGRDGDSGDTADDAATTADDARPKRRGRGGRALMERAETLERFRAVLAAAAAESPDAEPALYFLHLLMPHGPWLYLPSGQRYSQGGAPPSFRRCRGRWDEDPWPPVQGLQRYLLQLGYVDRLLGDLLAELDASSLGERALVVVVADHGHSFEPDTHCRRVEARNAGAILPVPLFVRFPADLAGAPPPGSVDDRPARTVDIVPTVADVLGMTLPGPVEGRSLLGPPPPHGTVTVLQNVLPRVRTLEIASARVAAERDRQRDRLTALVGSGVEGIFEIAPRPALRRLLGMRRENVPRPAGAEPIPHAEDWRWRNLDPQGEVLPLFVTGELAPVDGRARELAVLVDGVVRAVTRTVPLENGAPPTHFGALLPPSALRPGANRVEVLEVTPR